MGLPFCPAEFAKEFGAFFVMSAGGGRFRNLGGENFHSVAEAFMEQFAFKMTSRSKLNPLANDP